jgi:hypothetical protein
MPAARAIKPINITTKASTMKTRALKKSFKVKEMIAQVK